jgi:hypothetical protein
MAVTLSDKSIIMDKKKRITLAQEELELLYSILLNGSSLLENKSDEEKKSYRSLFEKTKKAYIGKE